MNKNKIIGMVVIFIAFVVTGYIVKTIFFSSKDAKVEEEKITIEKSEKKKVEENIPGQSKENSNIVSIDKSLGLEVPDEILEILPSDFEASFRNFVDESNLFTEGTIAKSDGYLIRDIYNDAWEFNLELNNYGKTVVTVDIDNKGETTYKYR